MTRIGKCFLLCGLLALAGGAVTAVSCSRVKDLRTRTLKLEIAVDQPFATASLDWDGRLRRVLAEAARRYESEFGIRWEWGKAAPWRSPAGPLDADTLLLHLKAAVPRDEADVLLGVSGKPAPPGRPGSTIPFDNTVLVFYDFLRDDAANARRVAHEVAHLFGAWHSGDTASLLHETAEGERFDSHAARMIRMMKRYDFRAGLAALDEKTEGRAQRAFEESGRPPGENPLIRAHGGAGVQALSRREHAEALRHMQAALRLNPHDAARHVDVAIALSGAGRAAEAEREFREALRLQPDRTSYREALAMALARSGKLEEAAAEFRELLRQSPARAQTHYNLAVVLVRQNRLADAERELQEAMRIQPGFLPAKAALAEIARRRP
jgi:tetratricopeptide (TPR) repeat protein